MAVGKHGYEPEIGTLKVLNSIIVVILINDNDSMN